MLVFVCNVHAYTGICASACMCGNQRKTKNVLHCHTVCLIPLNLEPPYPFPQAILLSLSCSPLPLQAHVAMSGILTWVPYPPSLLSSPMPFVLASLPTVEEPCLPAAIATDIWQMHEDQWYSHGGKSQVEGEKDTIHESIRRPSESPGFRPFHWVCCMLKH